MLVLVAVVAAVFAIVVVVGGGGAVVATPVAGHYLVDHVLKLSLCRVLA